MQAVLRSFGTQIQSNEINIAVQLSVMTRKKHEVQLFVCPVLFELKINLQLSCHQ